MSGWRTETPPVTPEELGIAWHAWAADLRGMIWLRPWPDCRWYYKGNIRQRALDLVDYGIALDFMIREDRSDFHRPATRADLWELHRRAIGYAARFTAPSFDEAKAREWVVAWRSGATRRK